MRKLTRYVLKFLAYGGHLSNVADICLHFYEGTSARQLAKHSKRGIV